MLMPAKHFKSADDYTPEAKTRPAKTSVQTQNYPEEGAAGPSLDPLGFVGGQELCQAL